ncbi:MAG: WD40/YVTN/BNR-like repeat-containing protein, partial [Planctomycetota bacterium]
STDEGESWTAVDGEPSSFGFAVCVHPRDPDSAWFVPAVKDECRVPVGGKLVVSRTRDGGRSFEVLRKGLPQEDAYDLVFRHAMDIDQSGGERLAFGSTTGSLWITEDQGDSWIPVTRHLPPVYTVRFARP